MPNYITNKDTIIFNPKWNGPLDIKLLSNYKKLVFSDYELSDNLFEKYEPDNSIFKGSKFNQEVNNLPNSLTHLTFGQNFNQEVNVLPNSITHLTFGICFNQKVNNLPNSLTHLTFGWKFNQEVNDLPKSLTHLTFNYDFNQKIDIPFTIKYLKLDCNNSYIIDYLPDNIEELELGCNFNLELNNLSISIKKIAFEIDSYYEHELNCLPKFLECLQLPCSYDKKLLNISDNLKIICSKNYKYKNDYIIVSLV